MLLVLSSVALAHDDRAFNPDRRADAPAYEPSRLDLLTESFEIAVPPAGWAMLSLGNADEEWYQTNAAAHSGLYSARLDYCPANETMDEWLITPALDFSTLTDITLEFYEDENYWADYGDHHYVMVSTTSQTDTGTFSIVSDMTPGTHNVSGFTGAAVSVDLSAYAGESTVYVALRYTGSDADIWLVDDVRIFEPWLHDLAVADIAPDDWQFAGGTTIPIQVIVKNIGRSTEDYDVMATVYEDGVQIYQETVNRTGLVPGSSIVVMLPTLTLGSGKYYDVVAEAQLASDMDTSNNQGTAFFDTYTLPHVPLGMMNTQSDCSGCPQANVALDAYIPGQGNEVAILRVHVWWPGTDALYDANIPQNNFLANGAGADYAPHLRIDQVVDAGSNGTGFEALYNNRKAYHSPLNIAHHWDPVTEIITVDVEVVQYMSPAWDLRLRVAFTEDDVFEDGTYGSSYHNQVFRYMYPDTDGFVVPTAPGVYRFTAHCPVSGEAWDYDKLRAVVYVQDNDTWKVHNAATGFLADLATVAVDDHEAPALLKVKGNHPNPFNPETTIKYELASERQVRVYVYDVDGSLVATLFDGLQAAGPQSVVWDGRDANGQSLASGTYFYRIDADGFSETRKMVMVK